MASRHDTRTSGALTSAEIEELLHRLSKLIDRVKVMYEQYFMGIQKVAPAQLHRDAERRIRELTQLNIRNTALRFRFANIKQKYGSYNTYWKRTMRQIENGTYLPHVKQMARRANRLGRDIPEEILAAMPKRVREKILRDRDRMRKLEDRKQGKEAKPEVEANTPAWRKESTIDENDLGDFSLADMDDDFNLDDAFASITAQAAAAVTKHTSPPPAPAPPAPAPPAPAPPAPPAPPAIPRPASTKPVPRPTSSATAPSPRTPVPRPTPRPARKPTPRPTPRPSAGTSPIPGMSVQQTQDLHRRYNQGQKMVGGGKPVSYAQLMKTLKRQAPKIIKQHNAKGVTFNVAIKGDKVILKAKPQK